MVLGESCFKATAGPADTNVVPVRFDCKDNAAGAAPGRAEKESLYHACRATDPSGVGREGLTVKFNHVMIDRFSNAHAGHANAATCPGNNGEQPGEHQHRRI